ncbi:MAG: FmdB family zinc ribbon protein [Gammaproteobacteria bacterium]
MPIYEYQCDDCGHKLEVMQRMSDDPLKTCPSCNEDALKKLISAVGFQLKGTGWYETDFKNKGKPAAKSGGEGGTDGGDKAAKSDGGGKDTGGDAKSKSSAATSSGD